MTSENLEALIIYIVMGAHRELLRFINLLNPEIIYNLNTCDFSKILEALAYATSACNTHPIETMFVPITQETQIEIGDWIKDNNTAKPRRIVGILDDGRYRFSRRWYEPIVFVASKETMIKQGHLIHNGALDSI